MAAVTALNNIMRRRHEKEKAQARQEADERIAQGLDGEHTVPPRRQCLAGGGSLAATGRVRGGFCPGCLAMHACVFHVDAELFAYVFASFLACHVAVTGLQMSLQQNRGAAISVEPEVEQVFHWFAARSPVFFLPGVCH